MLFSWRSATFCGVKWADFFSFFFSWYFGPLSREETNDILQNKEESGEFLVRDSQSIRGDFVLCVKWVSDTWTVTKSVWGDFVLHCKWVSTDFGQLLSQYKETLSCVSSEYHKLWTVANSVQGDFVLCVKWVSTVVGQSLSQYKETLLCVSSEYQQILDSH